MGSEAENKAKSCLRAYRHGRLIAHHSDGIDTRAEDIRFVLDRSGGSLVFPLSGTLLSLDEFTLHIPGEMPDDGGDRLELGIEISAEDIDEESRDRHLAYHDRVRSGVWVRALISAARFGSAILDGAEIAPPNTMSGIEPALCRAINADRALLAQACYARRRVRVTEATAVGVDNFGLDIRIALGVLRLEFDARVDDEARAREAIARILESPT